MKQVLEITIKGTIKGTLIGCAVTFGAAVALAFVAGSGNVPANWRIASAFICGVMGGTLRFYVVLLSQLLNRRKELKAAAEKGSQS
jgi:hypothetical protein